MKDIPGYEGDYAVTRDGNVWSRKNKKWLSPYKNKGENSYRYVGLHGKNKKIHRLVATTFLPNPLLKKEVNHRDGVKHHNNVENLEWCTKSENMKHAVNIGLMVSPVIGSKGTNHPKALLVREEVEQIRKMKGISQKKVGQIFNISQAHISKIIRGVYWK